MKRALVAVLMPNVLVWGFWMNGIDNDHNFMWHLVVGKYWFLEKVCIGLIGLYFLIKGIVAVWAAASPLVGAALSDFHENQHEREQIRQDQLIEAQHQAAVARIKQEKEEDDRAFQALPEDERNRIRADIIRREGERWRLVEEQNAEILRMEDARIKSELEAKAKEKARLDAIANDPDTKRRRALEELTGGSF